MQDKTLEKRIQKLINFAKRKIDCRESHKIPDEKCDECGLRYDCWTGTEFLDILIMFYSMLGDKYGKKDTTSEM